MRRSLLIATAFIGVVLLSSGCDIFGSDADYFPMSVGSVWNYEGYSLTEHTMDAVDTTMTMTQKIEALKKDNLDSGEEVTCFQMTTTTTLAFPETTYTTVDTGYLRKSGDYVLGYSSLGDTDPDTAFMTALAAGKTWTSEGATYEVIGQDDVSVMAGTYKNAWKVSVTEPPDTLIKTYMWYADGIGNVKSYMQHTPAPGYTVTYNNELTSATVK